MAFHLMKPTLLLLLLLISMAASSSMCPEIKVASFMHCCTRCRLSYSLRVRRTTMQLPFVTDYDVATQAAAAAELSA